MRLLHRIVEIITSKDIDWLELFVGWITLGFCVCLIAPGDYFERTPTLHALHYAGGLYLPELFWVTVFLLLVTVQGIAIAAGDKPFLFTLSPSRKLAISGYAIRMRVLAVGFGVWLSVAILSLPTAFFWYVHGVPVPASLGEWIFSGLALFSLAAGLRMAGKVRQYEDNNRRREVFLEAEKFIALAKQVMEESQVDYGYADMSSGVSKSK